MEIVQKRVLDRALVMLNSLKLEYVIRIPDGQNIVQGEFHMTDKPKRKQVHAKGEFRDMYRKMGVQKMKVGDVMVIPCGKYPRYSIQATLAGFATSVFGSGACVTALTKDSVEIMRVDIGSKNIEVIEE
jgi:hypothetical protein